MNPRETLAIIGTGPSCIYLLKHLLDSVERFRRHFEVIEVFEQRRTAGMGMPYHPETTERFNMSNISSVELPELTVPLGDWLRELDTERLEEIGVDRADISEHGIYSRLALGEYLRSQYRALIATLAGAGLAVREHAGCPIVDVREVEDRVALFDAPGERFVCDRVVVATGHSWPGDDDLQAGYYRSPWPIAKLLPAEGEVYNFTIGTLGASLSAFDVISSLAHRHGTFERKGLGLVFHPRPGTEAFRIVMHAADGLLPHLRYGQKYPRRAIDRHVSEQDLLDLRDEDGFLRFETYFDRVGRRVLIDAFEKDGMPELVGLLQDGKFGLVDFAEKMTDLHDYRDAFEGMRGETKAAENSGEAKPIYWKEALDDLMYTLNFYADLLPAEDHLTLHEKFLPFLLNVIAAMPLSSAHTLLALHDAGKLEIVAGKAHVEETSTEATVTTVTVEDEGGETKTEYRIFINCTGQKPTELENYPFPSLAAAGSVRAARAAFKDPAAGGAIPEDKKPRLMEEEGRPAFAIGGVDIDRSYRLVGRDGRASPKIHDIASPHTSGERPYSYGLQACNETARIVVAAWAVEFGESGPNQAASGAVAKMPER